MAASFRTIRSSGVLLHAREGVSDEWVRTVFDEAAEEPRGFRERPLPPEAGGGTAFIKIYGRRPAHGILRRLRPGRAADEGNGYRAFEERGIETPRLLFYGERRRRGLLEFGLVATAKVDAPTVAQAWAREGGGLLEETVRVLGAIHRAGLAHGDPRTRNFLATKPRPIPFDLPSWAVIGRAARRRDLVRFLGSARALTGDPSAVERLIGEYTKSEPATALAPAGLARAAEAYAEEKGEP